MTCTINTAVAGRKIRELTAEPKLCGDPDVVFVLIGLNDTDQRKSIHDTYKTMVSNVKKYNPDSEVILITYPYVLTGDYTGAQECINAAIRQVATETNTRLIDTDTGLNINLGDGIHPNIEGNLYIGQTVANAINMTGVTTDTTVVTTNNANVVQ